MKNMILKTITSAVAMILILWAVSLDSVFELPLWVALAGFGWIYYFGWANDWFPEETNKKRPRHGARP